ncbi:hypothetical protein J4526_08080 [Desulfurococcaceae archaeon MEX13E-LK6-19]|nr:hypothetical protein J4526_08080 [Desulfurococcaceae archaeon MEX13E-LK6-19]
MLQLDIDYKNGAPITSSFKLVLLNPKVIFYQSDSNYTETLMEYFKISSNDCENEGGLLVCRPRRIVLERTYEIKDWVLTQGNGVNMPWIWSLPSELYETLIPIPYTNPKITLFNNTYPIAGLLVYDESNTVENKTFSYERLVKAEPVVLKKLTIYNPSQQDYRLANMILERTPGNCTIVENTSKAISVVCGLNALNIYNEVKDKLPWSIEEYRINKTINGKTFTITYYMLVLNGNKHVIATNSTESYWSPEYHLLIEYHGKAMTDLPPLYDLLSPSKDINVVESPDTIVKAVLVSEEQRCFNISIEPKPLALVLITVIIASLAIALYLLLRKRI